MKKLLPILFLAVSSFSFSNVASAADSPIEGVDRETYNRNTYILQQNRHKAADVYVDYKSGWRYDEDEIDYSDEYNYSEYEYEEDNDSDKVIKGAF